MSKVLIAEDEPALLECFRDVVSGLGHECLEARDGNEALDMARKHQPDLLITDYMMPGRSGADVIAALRKDAVLAQMPAILVSAGRPPEEERRLAWRFLTKPVNLESFEHAIAEGLKHSAEARPRNGAFVAGVPDAAPPEAVLREQMLSWVAHEIKSPLAAAMTNAQLGLRAVREPGREDAQTLERRFVTIVKQLMRMDELVMSILDAAQLQDGKLQLALEDIRINELSEKLSNFWRDMHPDYNFVLTGEVDAVIEADAERVRQILDNLISNAIKYGGASKRIELVLSATDAHVSVGVKDEGKGIPAADLPHIFDRFHRIAGQGGRGHGLGLYVAAALARLHGGVLRVESEVERGSMFTLVLPRKG